MTVVWLALFPRPCGGGSFQSGMQSPTGAKRRFAGRIPKRRLGTTGVFRLLGRGELGEEAEVVFEEHSQVADAIQ